MTLVFSMVVCSYQGGRKGVRIPQTRTEMRVNTAQNNMRKPQNALKLPENFLILETTWFCKTAIPQLQIKLPQNCITANPYAPLLIPIRPAIPFSYTPWVFPPSARSLLCPGERFGQGSLKSRRKNSGTRLRTFVNYHF